MTPEQAVLDRIKDIGAVSALFSDRVYQLRLPQGSTLPAVRVQHVGEVGSMHQRGETNLFQTRVQVDAYAGEASGADPYSEATALADAIHGDWQDGSPAPPNGLSGWQGYSTGSPPAIRVLAAIRVARALSYEADELRQVRVRQDYQVTWKRL
jgi:hypothetical protein